MEFTIIVKILHGDYRYNTPSDFQEPVRTLCKNLLLLKGSVACDSVADHK